MSDRPGPPLRRRVRHAREPSVTRWVVLLGLLGLLALVGALTWRAAGTSPPLTAVPAGGAGSEPAGLEVHVIDVGQGDATLLHTAQAAVLVDTGRHDRDDLVGYLRAAVEALDVVILTHPHADHIGQLDRVLDAFDVAEVWWSGATHTTRTFERAVAALEASGAAYEEPRAGDHTFVGDLSFAFANPPEDADFDDLHDSGLAFRVRYGDVSLLFTGDAEAPTEERMITRHADLLAADVYQIGHHGSSTSSTPAFLDAVSPRVAVYSAGRDNPYGHPHRDVVARLAGAGAVVLGTDTHGTILLTSDGRRIVVEPSRGEPVTVE